jgi:hypothetical protein
MDTVIKVIEIWLVVAFIVAPLAGHIIHRVSPTDEGGE